MNKKYSVIFSGVLIFCLLVIGYGIWLVFSSSDSQPISVTPTPIPGVSTTSGGNSTYPNEKYQAESIKNLDTPIEKEAHEKAGNIIKLRDSLPYTGSAFSLRYTISNNVYTATLTPSNKIAGEEELKQYLASFDLTENDISLVIQ